MRVPRAWQEPRSLVNIGRLPGTAEEPSWQCRAAGHRPPTPSLAAAPSSHPALVLGGLQWTPWVVERDHPGV